MKKTMRIMATLGAMLLTASSAIAEGERIVMVGHWSEADSFFNVIRNAAELAGDQLDVNVEFLNPAGGDLSEMGRMIAQAAASKPDGIITTIADFDLLKGPIGDAIAAGIPVVTINSGSSELSEQLGAIRYVGQAEYTAGLAAGKLAKASGATDFVCVNHFYSHPVSLERCQGFADGLGVELSGQNIDSGTDPSGIVARTAAYLENADADAILTLGPTGAEPIIKYLRDTGQDDGSIYFATFDLSENIIEAMQSGLIKVAIDQQPFLQGYESVKILTFLKRYGVLQANDISAGPGIITLDNLEQVLSLAGEWR